MLPSKFGYYVFILVIFTCFIPITQAYKPKHHKHHYEQQHHERGKHHRRSPNHTHESGIKIVVNRTIINVTTTTNNADSKPKLKSVNLVSDMDGVGDSRGNYNPNPNRNQQITTKKVEEAPHTVQDNRKLLDTNVFKSLLKDLLTRLDTFTPQQPQQERKTFTAPGSEGAVNSYNGIANNEEGLRHINSHNARHCVLHGLWLSTVAGAAIELLPEQQEGHIEIHTKIFELPDNPYPPLINSQWTGKGIISQESPTTLTIVFQEHINTEKENHAGERGGESGNENDSGIDIQLPRTAVFVGQCLVCQGNPTLQGAWVVFPASQTCTTGAGFSWANNINNNEIQAQSGHKRDSIRMATPDAIYLLRYY